MNADIYDIVNALTLIGGNLKGHTSPFNKINSDEETRRTEPDKNPRGHPVAPSST